MNESLPSPPVPDQFSPEEKTNSIGRAIWRFVVDVVETLVLALVMFILINLATARVRVDGHSMDPTLQNGEFILVNRLAYRFGQPQRGDIVVFLYPGNPHQQYIKRVIGLPGEEVRIQRGKVYINGQPLEEPYIAAPPRYEGVWQVPAGTLFVLGDNRNKSSDSHSWGMLPLENVVGKAVLVYWPPSQLGWITHSGVANAGAARP